MLIVAVSHIHSIQQAHHDLLAIATAKLGELKAGKAHVDDGLLEYLRNWLKNHIKSSDIPSYGGHH
jgi:hypothetical protein